MDFEKYTERARGFVQAAQNVALREGHQRFTPEHLLKVLLDDPEGLAAGLIRTAGGDPASLSGKNAINFPSHVVDWAEAARAIGACQTGSKTGPRACSRLTSVGTCSSPRAPCTPTRAACP